MLAEDDSEAVGDQRGGELATPPEPMPEHKPAAARGGDDAQRVGRSALLPPEAPEGAAVPPVSAGPRVAGPSTMPRPPLPPKPKGP